ncbi:MAG TPA: response regulator [bacterium]|nr:response regulator [bacterium]
MNIVIVDDDKKILEMLERAFVMETDYKIITTTNPIEAYDIVTKQKIDLVITDIQMPEMNGLDLLKKIKKTNGMVQVITMTAYTSFDNVMTALRRGSYEIFLKPFKDVQEIVKCARELENKIKRWKQIIIEITRK